MKQWIDRDLCMELGDGVIVDDYVCFCGTVDGNLWYVVIIYCFFDSCI